MDLARVTAPELLDAWRDAARAAELAERLASTALHAADRADGDAATAEELALLAEEAATAAERAARAAREAAMKAATHATGLRAGVLCRRPGGRRGSIRRGRRSRSVSGRRWFVGNSRERRDEG